MTAERERVTRYVRLDDIKGAPRNPKLHDRAGIALSINEHGLAELPLLDERTGRLVAGHGRINSLRIRKAKGDPPPADVSIDTDGEWLVPVQGGWASRDDKHAAAYLSASNRLSENGGWDEDSLPDFLTDLAGDGMLELAGWTQRDLDKMLGLGGGDDDAPLDGEADENAGSDWGVVISCRSADEQDDVLTQLRAEGYTVRALTA